MTDKEKKNKIADILLDFYDEYHSNEINRPMIPSIYADKILDSMQEEPVSKDLDSFAIKYAQDKPYPVTVCQAVKVGANWQKEQIMKEAITGQLENGEDYLRIKCLYTSCRPQDDGKLVKFIIINED